MPRFSIVIPCFNARDFVSDAVDSCLVQTESDLEVILIDDGSTDGSAETLAKCSRDSRVRIVRQANRGLGAARNAGLALASGEWVNFLDADDLFEPNKLEQQAAAGAPEVGLVLCDGVSINAKGEVAHGHLIEPRRFFGHPPLFEVLFCGGQFPPHVPLVRRKLALDVGGFDERREAAGWADTGFWIRCALQGADYRIVDQCLCRYRVHGANMSADREGMERAARSIYEALLKDYPMQSATALRVMHGRLDDLWNAVSALRMAVAVSEAERARLACALEEERNLRAAEELRRHADLLEQRIRALARQGSDPTRARPVYIWGAGSGGRRVLRLLREAGGDARGFVDSDPSKAGARIDGVAVSGIEAVSLDEGPRAFVVVASSFASGIIDRLDALGRREEVDYAVVDFDAVAEIERRNGGGGRG
jgi:glycosyltransferase involved in cell wall biosynthesis